MAAWITRTNRWIVLGLIGLVLTACLPNRSKTADTLKQGSDDIQKFDNSLKFSNVVLEQADEKGQLWWKVKAAQASYSKDQKIAQVEKPQGELFQDGKAVFQISAAKGEVIQDGKSIVLKGQITAKDLRDGTVMQGQEIEWKPTEDRLFVRKKFTGTHKDMKITGDEGRFLSRKREAEIIGQVVAEVKQPNLKMQTTQLKWFVEQQKIVGDKPLQIDRIENKQVTDQATAEKGEYNFKDQIAALSQNAQVTMPSQKIQAKSNQLVWNLKQQQVNATQPITLVNMAQQVTLTGDRGDLNIPQQKATLVGNVKGLSLQNQANVSADNLVWFLQTQSFEATGKINYQQVNPPFNLVGTRASGTLQTQEVEISGGPEGDNRVVTEIMPNFAR
jgi:LPS export ABC transporter protein LptC